MKFTIVKICADNTTDEVIEHNTQLAKTEIRNDGGKVMEDKVSRDGVWRVLICANLSPLCVTRLVVSEGVFVLC